MAKPKKTFLGRSRKIVCLGGGNAMPKVVLEGLKKYPVKLSVICAVLDSGGSAGKLRKAFQTSISFGDIRRAALVLAEADSTIKNKFAHRDSDGHVVANVFCTAYAIATSSSEIAIQKLADRLKVPKKYQILPATLDNAQLFAILENGETVNGEGNIDVPKHNKNLEIEEVFLSPPPAGYPLALEAINQANLIIIGPGDLYSSLAQILLIEEISKAIRESRAKKIYICNLMTKYGETNKFSVLDFTLKIEEFLNGHLDYVIYNNSIPPKKTIKKYKKQHPELLDLVRINPRLPTPKFIGENLLKEDLIEHHPDKLAKIILKLCRLR